MKYKVAIFDMDGTILNTIEDLADSFNYCLKEVGLPERTIDEFKMFVGNGNRRALIAASPKDTSVELIDKMENLFIPYYNEHSSIKTKPYDGILEALKVIKSKGIKLAVVSNKYHYAVVDLCDKLFNGVFDIALGYQPPLNKKPNPDMVNYVLKELGISKKEAVFAGDSEVDYETAINADLDVVMVTWGFRKKEMLIEKGVSNFADTPDELVKKIIAE